MAQVSATPVTGNTEALEKPDERPKDLSGLQKSELEADGQSAQSKRKYLIRRDTPMDLSKQHLKQKNFRPAFTENFIETTTASEPE